MSDYTVTIQDRNYQIKINKDEKWLNDKQVHQEFVPLNHTGLHLMQYGKTFVEFHMDTYVENAIEVQINGRRIIANIEDNNQRKTRRLMQDNSKTLTAPMPGLVVEVPVKPGDEVEKGSILVVLESMKMQMQLKAEASGIISEIKVEAGSQVEKGCTMVRIE